MFANQQTLRSNKTVPANSGVRIKTIALPAEHGGWGFLLEPIALGLLLAPSIAGVYLALAAIGVFLARHPLTLVVLNRGRVSPRSMLARRFAALYLIIGTLAFVAAIAFTQHSFILPIAIAAPFATVQIIFEWSGRRRVLLAELAGVIAISSLAAALPLAAGWPASTSFALWAVMICRSAPAILYVRECLARLHGRRASVIQNWIAHALALVAVFGLARAGFVPRLAFAAMIILLVRAVWGFRRVRVTAKQLGFSEIGFGALTVLAVVFGNSFGW